MHTETPENGYHFRNQFFIDNYSLFDQLSNICAKKVNRMFPCVMVCDLVSYALEGILIALDKVDYQSATWIAYVKKYAFLSAINGALTMIGRQRIRTSRGQNNLTHLNITYVEHDVLVQYADQLQSNNCDDIDSVFYELMDKDQIRWFLVKLKNTLQYKILKSLLKYHSVSTIAKNCNISRRKARNIILSLPNIFQMAVDNMDISGYLTPVLSAHGYADAIKKKRSVTGIKTTRHYRPHAFSVISIKRYGKVYISNAVRQEGGHLEI